MPVRHISEWVLSASGGQELKRTQESIGREGSRAQDRWNKGIDATNQRLRTLDTASRGLQTGLGNIARQGVAFGAGLAGLSSVSAIVSDATRRIIEFDDSFANVTTLLGSESPAAIARLREELKAIPPEFARASDAAQAAYNAISLGVQVPDVAGFVQQAGILARGGGTDLATSTDAIARTLNAFRLEATEASNVADIFFDTVNAGGLTIDEFVQNMGSAIPTAAGLKLGFEDVGEAIATLTSGAFRAPEAFTVFNALLNDFLTNSDKFKKAGVDILGVLEQQGFAGAVTELRRLTGGSAEELKKFLSSSEALKAALDLTGDGYDTFIAKTKQVGEVAGSSFDAFGAKSESLQSRLETLGAAWEQFILRLEPALEFLTDLGSAQLADISREIDMISGGLSRASDFLTGAVTAPTVDTSGLEQARKAIEELTKSIEEQEAQIQRANAKAEQGGFIQGLLSKSGFGAEQNLDRQEARLAELTAQRAEAIKEFTRLQKESIALDDQELSNLQGSGNATKELTEAVKNLGQAKRETASTEPVLSEAELKRQAEAVERARDAVEDFIEAGRDRGRNELESALASLKNEYEDIRAEALAAGVSVDALTESFLAQQESIQTDFLDDARSQIREFAGDPELLDLSPFRQALRGIREEFQQLENDLAGLGLQEELARAFDARVAQETAREIRDVNEAISEYVDQADDVQRTDIARRINQVNQEYERLKTRADEAGVATDGLAEANRRLVQSILDEPIAEAFDELTRRREELFGDAAEDIGNQFSDSLFNVLTGRFAEGAENLTDVIRDVFARKVSEIAQALIFEPEVLFGEGGPGTGGLRPGEQGPTTAGSLAAASELRESGGAGFLGSSLANLPGLRSLAGIANRPLFGTQLTGLQAVQGIGAGIGVGTTASGLLGQAGVGGRTGGALSGALGGAAFGATIGSVIPGIGTLVGAGVGALAGGITGALAGGGSDSHTSGQLFNFQRYTVGGAENPVENFSDRAFRTTDFGDIAVQVDNARATQILDTIEQIDEQLADFLSTRQVQLAREYLTQLRQTGHYEVDEGDIGALTGNLLRDRLTQLVAGVSGDYAIAARTFEGVGDDPSNEAVVRAASRALNVLRVIEDIRFPVDNITASEQAITSIREEFDEYIEVATRLGLAQADLTLLYEERARQIANVAIGFNNEVERQIAAIRTPVLALADDLFAQMTEQMREARGAAANLVRVQTLHGLQQRNFLDQQIELGRQSGQGARSTAEAIQQVTLHFGQLAQVAERFGFGQEDVQRAFHETLASLRETGNVVQATVEDLTAAIRAFIEAGNGLTPLGNQMRRLFQEFARLQAAARDVGLFDELFASLRQQVLELQRPFVQDVQLRALEFDDPQAAERFRLYFRQVEEIRTAEQLRLGASFIERLRALHQREIDELQQRQAEERQGGVDIPGVTESNDALRNSIREFVEAANPLTDTGRAIRDLRRQATELTDAAREAGLSTAGISESLRAQIGFIQRDLQQQLRVDILNITNPLQGALAELEIQQEERLRSFIEAGLRTVELERLFALERQQVIEQFAGETTESLTRTLDEFLRQQTATSAAAPFITDETLAQARRAFNRALRDGTDQDLITSTAQDLIDLGVEFFGIGQQASDIYNQVIGAVTTLRDRIEDQNEQDVQTVAFAGPVQTVTDTQTREILIDVGLELGTQTNLLREIRNQVIELNVRLDTYIRLERVA